MNSHEISSGKLNNTYKLFRFGDMATHDQKKMPIIFFYAFFAKT